VNAHTISLKADIAAAKAIEPDIANVYAGE